MRRTLRRIAGKGVAVEGGSALSLALRVGRAASLRIDRAAVVAVRLRRGIRIDARHRLGVSTRLPGGIEFEAERDSRLQISPGGPRRPRRRIERK